MMHQRVYVGCLIFAAWMFAPKSAVFAASPPFDQNPFAPASAQVLSRFDLIEAEVARLRSIGFEAQALSLQTRLQQFRAELTGGPSPFSGPEMDIVGIHTGTGGSSSNVPSSVSVHVTATGRPVVLALASYSSIDWTLQVDPGVQFRQIIVSSYYPSRVVNAPAGVLIDTVSPGKNAYQLDYGSYPVMERFLRTYSGNVPVTSFVGAYTPSGVYTIGNSVSNWRTQRVLHDMHQTYLEATEYARSKNFEAVIPIQFDGLFNVYTQDNYGYKSLTSSIPATFNVDGVTKFNGSQTDMTFENFALLPGARGYGQRSGGIYEVDLATGKSTVIPPPDGNVIPFCGITPDSARQRVIVSTYGGEGFLFAYAPSSKQWTTLATLHNIDLQSIAYLPSTDMIYGLTMAASDNKGSFRLEKYDSAGNLLGEVEIGAIIPSGYYSSDRGLQLLPAGDLLAIVAAPAPDLYQLDVPDETHTFLIDPRTGALRYPVIQIPEPAAASLVLLLLLRWRHMRPAVRIRCRRAKHSEKSGRKC